MIKRLLAILAIGVALMACSPAASSSPDTDTSPAAPSESVETSPEASPSAS